MYLLVCEGFEGYLKNANSCPTAGGALRFLKPGLWREIIFLRILARKLLEEEESLPLRMLFFTQNNV